MRRQDVIAFIYCILLFFIMFIVVRNGMLANFNIYHPYCAGFVQFFVFASAGEFISTRILTHSWQINKMLFCKALIWGVGGMVITLNFRMFFIGTRDAMEVGLLPFKGNNVVHAFYTSSANNLMYGPIHSAFTIIAGAYLELKVGQGRKVSLSTVINSIDWAQFVNFIIFKCIPFFWIPVNTLTFLLPSEYRVACAAILSLIYGILITLLKLKQKKIYTY